MQHSNLPQAAADEVPVEPVYTTPRRHVAAGPNEVSHLYCKQYLQLYVYMQPTEKRSLHYAEVDHSIDAPKPPLPAELVQYATVIK